MTEISKFLYANLNGATETVVLFMLVSYDTILGVKWRKAKGVPITSEAGLKGLKSNLPLTLFPIGFWSISVIFSVLPTHIGNRIFVFDTPIFDGLAFASFIFIGQHVLRSLIVNARLSGYDLPQWLIKWAEDEYHVKIQKIEDGA